MVARLGSGIEPVVERGGERDPSWVELGVAGGGGGYGEEAWI